MTSDSPPQDLDMTTIEQLKQQLPKAILLPLDSKSKKPTIQGYRSLTHESIKGKEAYHYRVSMAQAHGVLLGPNTGYATIDIDVDEEVEPFLELNPKLRGTLATKRDRGCNFWLRMKGTFPKTYDLKRKDNHVHVGEWRGSGFTAISGTIGGKPYKQISEANHPIEIRFDEIIWPDYILRPWAGEGNGVFLDEAGKLLDEVGLAQLFAEDHPVIYEPLEGRHFRYNDDTGAWEARTNRETVVDIIAFMRQLAVDTERGEIVNACTMAKVDKVEQALQAIMGRREIFETARKENGNLIHAANCMLEVSPEGIMQLPFDPTYYSRNPLPLAFEEGATCPRTVNEFLLPLFGDMGVVNAVQEYIGMVLLGRNITGQILVVDGTADGGKSTFCNLLKKMIGLRNCGELTSFMAKQFALSGWVGKTLLAGVDVPSDFLETKACANLKKYTGSDAGLEAEFKGVNDRKLLSGRFNVMITSNSRQRCWLENDIEAWRRRIIVARVDLKKMPKGEDEFEEKLLEQEGSGILNFGLEGLQRLMSRLAEDSRNRIALTPEMIETRDDMIDESRGLEVYLDACLVEDTSSDVTLGEITQGFNDYATLRDWNLKSKKKIRAEITDLIEHKFGRSGSNDIVRPSGAQRGYHGLKLTIQHNGITA